MNRISKQITTAIEKVQAEVFFCISDTPSIIGVVPEVSRIFPETDHIMKTAIAQRREESSERHTALGRGFVRAAEQHRKRQTSRERRFPDAQLNAHIRHIKRQRGNFMLTLFRCRHSFVKPPLFSSTPPPPTAAAITPRRRRFFSRAPTSCDVRSSFRRYTPRRATSPAIVCAVWRHVCTAPTSFHLPDPVTRPLR